MAKTISELLTVTKPSDTRYIKYSFDYEEGETIVLKARINKRIRNLPEEVDLDQEAIEAIEEWGHKLHIPGLESDLECDWYSGQSIYALEDHYPVRAGMTLLTCLNDGEGPKPLLLMCHSCGHCEEKNDDALRVCPHCHSLEVSYGSRPPFKKKPAQREAVTLSGNALRGWQKNYDKNHPEEKDEEEIK